MVGDDGQVLGVEKHKELAHRSIQSLQQAVPDLMKKGTIKIMPGNVLGKVLGEYGPFDAIHVGAAAASMPQVAQPFLSTFATSTVKAKLQLRPYSSQMTPLHCSPMLVTLPGRIIQACDDDILCHATAAADAFIAGFFTAESDSEAEAWWQNGHTCGRAECNAGIFSPLL